uniref:Transposase n=1 Tax=Romanomermis culicivorax TaxID=13658 RepID=A0A915J533_ROMCU
MMCMIMAIKAMMMTIDIEVVWLKGSTKYDLTCTNLSNAVNTWIVPNKAPKEVFLFKRSVQRILKENDVHVFKRVRLQELNAKTKEKRLNRVKRLLRLIKKSEMDQIIFTDEKDFLIDTPPVNTQNCRVYSKEKLKRNVPPANLIIERKHFPKKIMVWAGVSKRGKTSIHFVEPKSKLKVEVRIVQSLLFGFGFELGLDESCHFRMHIVATFLDPCHKDKFLQEIQHSADLKNMFDYAKWEQNLTIR